MKKYTLFKRSGEWDGVIYGSFPYVIAPTLSNWEGYHFEGEYDGTYYFHDGEPKKRPDCQAHLDGLTLKSVPIGSKIIIDGETYTADSDNVTLNFPFVGTYHVTLIPPFPYLDKEFTIDYQP